MELYIDKSFSKSEYFVNLKGNDNYNKMYLDSEIIELLDLSLEEYRIILIKYGGFHVEINSDIYFKIYKDCERALNSEELMPKRIMLKLMG